MGLLKVKKVLVLSFLFERMQIPTFCIYKWLWNTSKCVCVFVLASLCDTEKRH